MAAAALECGHMRTGGSRAREWRALPAATTGAAVAALALVKGAGGEAPLVNGNVDGEDACMAAGAMAAITGSEATSAGAGRRRSADTTRESCMYHGVVLAALSAD